MKYISKFILIDLLAIAKLLMLLEKIWVTDIANDVNIPLSAAISALPDK
jgi:hypothetical protein